MKKAKTLSFILLLMYSLCNIVIAQFRGGDNVIYVDKLISKSFKGEIITPPPHRPDLNSSNSYKTVQGAGETKSVWLNYGQTIKNSGTNSVLYRTDLFPDTAILFDLENGQYSRPGLHMVGDVLDISAPVFEIPWDKNSEFTVDSIGILYRYYRNHPDPTIVDTLIIYLYNNKDPLNLSLNYIANEEPGDNSKFPRNNFGVDTLWYALQGYDYTKHMPAKRGTDGNPIGEPSGLITIKYPLTIADTSMSKNSEQVFKIDNFNVPVGGLVASAVTFKPGYSYTANDTLNKMNYFQFLSYEENGTNTFPSYRENDWNASSVVTSEVRDNKSINNGILVPTWAFPQDYHFEHHLIFYKITGVVAELSTSVKEVAINSIALYQNQPNPVVAGTSVIYYDLKKVGNVNLYISDIAGRKIKEIINERQEAGKHSVSINVRDFKEGIYFYTLNVNGVSITKKMIISH